MLKVFDSSEKLDFGQLMDVYTQWNQKNGAMLYPKLMDNLQVLYSEQDFYAFLEEFFVVKDAKYYVWEIDGHYCAALRIEPYLDGLLVEAVETTPAMRGRGMASSLLSATIASLRTGCYSKIYSHVQKDNEPSLKLHKKCGFFKIADSAQYIDGSYHDDSYTLICEI